MKKTIILFTLVIILTGCGAEPVGIDVNDAKNETNLSGARMLVYAGNLAIGAGDITKEGKYTCIDMEFTSVEKDAYGIKLDDSNCYIIVDKDLNITNVSYGKNVKNISVEELEIKNEE
jgi:hypothetical protein